MSEEMMQTSPFECPAWFDGKKINETVFCEEFLRDYPMVTVNDAFFTVNGRVHDENRLKKVIYDRIKYYVTQRKSPICWMSCVWSAAPQSYLCTKTVSMWRTARTI